MIIWNYNDRFGSTKTSKIDDVDEIIVSTKSLISISTNKTKSNPQGQFQVVLAPNRNWVSTITPGSWCVIMMSNSPFSKEDISKKADPNKVKMIGKIDSVRVGTQVDETGAINTLYYVTGIDWGYIFNNIIYIDNNLTAPTSLSGTLGDKTSLAIQKLLFGENGYPQRYDTTTIIKDLLKVLGKSLPGFAAFGQELGLIDKAVYTLKLPSVMVNYLGIKSNKPFLPPKSINDAIQIKSGRPSSDNDSYKDTNESWGIIDPFSLQGTNSFWQILIDNSNPMLNELIADMRPSSDGISLNLYKRIKPFTVKGTSIATSIISQYKGSDIVSYFQNVYTHTIDPLIVKSVNAGTNWADKYNFIEIKPLSQEYRIIEPTLKKYTQSFDSESFNREGFRPFITTTRHVPKSVSGPAEYIEADWDKIRTWTQLLRSWYFDTHKMLNGTIELTGLDEYIAVGDNIMFDSILLNPNKNYSYLQSKAKKSYILAHVETVNNNFTVLPDGARQFTTSIQFVRGILVDENKKLLTLDGSKPDAGAVDKQTSLTPKDIDLNTSNTIIFGDK
jgi:hypothetical protein